MLREAQLSTRNMVNAVTEEFWKMVRGSINDQALHFKSTVVHVYVHILCRPLLHAAINTYCEVEFYPVHFSSAFSMELAGIRTVM